MARTLRGPATARSGNRGSCGGRYRCREMMNHSTLQGFSRADAVRGRRLNRETLRRVLTWIRPYRRMLTAFVATVILDAVVGVIPPLLVRDLLDNALPDKNRTLVATLALAAVALAFV